MGLLKELREKQAAGTITDEEAKQLQELEADIKADEGDEDEDKAVNELAEKLAEKAQGKVNESISKMEAIVDEEQDTLCK